MRWRDSFAFMKDQQAISGRTFKYLRSITHREGMLVSDQDIHDMGYRLTVISAVLTRSETLPKRDFDLDNREADALRAIREFPAAKTISARHVSQALGYASSRSGHQLLNRLI